MPLVDVIRTHVLAAERIHADDTTVPVLAKGKTRVGRLWTYVRDDRPFGGPDPPAAVFFYSRDRGGEHPEQHLAGYAGLMQADAYAGFSKLYQANRKPDRSLKRRAGPRPPKFFDLARLSKAPIATEAVKRIDALFAIERAINGQSPRSACACARSVAGHWSSICETWLREQRAKLSKNSDTAKAINYMLNRWAAFTRFLDDGRLHLEQRRRTSAARRRDGESLCNPSSSICKHWKHVFAATRHGRPFRATAVFTGSVSKSSARIWYGAPRTTCSAASTPV